MDTNTAAPTSAATAMDRQTDTGIAQDPAQTAASPKEEALSPKFAILARKERALREQRKAIEAKEAELKARESEYTQASTFKTSFKDRFAQDPYGALAETGLSFEQMQQLLTNPPNPGDMALRQLRQEQEALKAQLEEQSGQMKKAQTSQYEQALSHYRSQANALLAKEPDRFEMIATEGAQESIVKLIEETFHSEQRVMTVEEAADEIEEFLLERAMKVANAKKIRAKLNPEPVVDPAQAQSTVAKQQPQTQGLKTLTDRITQTSTKPLSGKERRERAILAFQNKL